MIEEWTSRSWHRTQDGDTVEMIWQATWAEWSTGTGIPLIGDPITLYTGWSDKFAYLLCSDVQALPVSNTECKIIALFSTVNKPARPKAEDERSWVLTIENASQQAEIDRYYDRAAAEWKTWSGKTGVFRAEVEPDEEVPIPAIYEFKPSVAMRLTAYGQYIMPQSVLSEVGKINLEDSFFDYLFLVPEVNIKVKPTERFGNDQYSWLFMSCPITQEGVGLYRYDMTFVHAGYNSDGKHKNWNYQYDQAVNNYETSYFIAMLAGLKGAPKDTAGGDR